LDWIVMKTLEKDRGRRYETANSLARDVERYLKDEPVEACPPSVSYRLRKFVNRNRGRVIVAGVLAGMLFLVVGLVLYGTWWAERQSAERRHEQELTAARNNDAFKATLDQIEAALRSARLAEAATMMGQADKQLNEQTPTDLRGRHERLRLDERTVRELEDIFEERWVVSPSGVRINNEEAKQRYPSLFQNYGMDVGNESAAAIAGKIRQAVITEALSSAITEWFFVDPKHSGLRAILDLLDPERSHSALRAAIANEDNKRIQQLSATIDGSRLSPSFAVGLVNITPFGGLPEHHRILKAAWDAHPESFPLALTISTQLCGLGGEHSLEGAGWSRTAISLRPHSALAHYYLALALCDTVQPRDPAKAVEELRRAIQYAPRFTRAYERLAMVLYFHQNLDNGVEALSVARKAIGLDSQSVFGHLVLYATLDKKKEPVEAIRLLRRLCELQKNEGLRLLSRTYAFELLDNMFARVFINRSVESLMAGDISENRPFEAYRIAVENIFEIKSITITGFTEDPPNDTFFSAVRAAALAGTGQGIDAPPQAGRVAIRKQALDWLTDGLATWKAFADGDPSKHGEVANKRMTHWLGDPDLAGVREDQWLDKLPADERDEWRKLWSEVRSLRDRTAVGKTPAKP
jgi:tetratricopeptide (TPR) repeat protein